MATEADYLTQTKYMIGLEDANTDFDTELTQFVNDARKLLFPIAQRELPVETYTLAKDTYEVDLDDAGLTNNPNSLIDIEIQDPDTDYWQSYTDFTQRERIVKLAESYTTARNLRLHGLGRYAQLTQVPDELEEVITNWGASKFYLLLAGNARKYNLYIETAGARNTDNMRDMSEYFLDRGNQLLIDRASIRG